MQRRPCADGILDRVLGDQRLAGAGRSGDQDVGTLADRLDRLALEGIQDETAPALDRRGRRRRKVVLGRELASGRARLARAIGRAKLTVFWLHRGSRIGTNRCRGLSRAQRDSDRRSPAALEPPIRKLYLSTSGGRTEAASGPRNRALAPQVPQPTSGQRGTEVPQQTSRRTIRWRATSNVTRPRSSATSPI